MAAGVQPVHIQIGLTRNGVAAEMRASQKKHNCFTEIN